MTRLKHVLVGCLIGAALSASAAAQPSPGSLMPCPDTLDAAGGFSLGGCACWRPTSAPVWGTDVYTSDSAICAAAVHAGIASMNGRTVQVVAVPGRQSYAGTTRNGVASQAHGPARRSFRVERLTTPWGAAPR